MVAKRTPNLLFEDRLSETKPPSLRKVRLPIPLTLANYVSKSYVKIMATIGGKITQRRRKWVGDVF